MRKYFHRLQSKAPHERRQHALQVATGVTAIVFVAWITTLGLRLAGPGSTVAQDGSSNQTQLANVGSAYGQSGNSLEVATTSETASQGITLPYAR